MYCNIMVMMLIRILCQIFAEFENGIFSIQSGYKYHLMIATQGCDCTQNGVVIEYNE